MVQLHSRQGQSDMSCCDIYNHRDSTVSDLTFLDVSSIRYIGECRGVHDESIHASCSAFDSEQRVRDQYTSYTQKFRGGGGDKEINTESDHDKSIDSVQY